MEKQVFRKAKMMDAIASAINIQDQVYRKLTMDEAEAIAKRFTMPGLMAREILIEMFKRNCLDYIGDIYDTGSCHLRCS